MFYYKDIGLKDDYGDPVPFAVNYEWSALIQLCLSPIVIPCVLIGLIVLGLTVIIHTVAHEAFWLVTKKGPHKETLKTDT